jgi:hypothetical protein
MSSTADAFRDKESFCSAHQVPRGSKLFESSTSVILVGPSSVLVLEPFVVGLIRNSDVLRRHYNRCPSRGGKAIPSQLQRGRRKRACDRCARLKLACDADLPCETCLSQGAICTGSRIDEPANTVGSMVESHTHGNLPTPPDVVESPIHEARASGRERVSLSFLLNYAHPKNRSLASAFGVVAAQEVDSSGSHHDGEGSCELAQDISSPEAFAPYSPNMVFQFFLGEFDLALSPLADNLADWPVSSRPADPLLSPLQGAANNLVDELTHFSSSWSQHRTGDRSHESLVAGFSLFTAGKIRDFVDDYFLRWNHHSPVIHAASFDIATAHTPLLLAVCLTSALLTPDSEDASAARSILDFAEEYVFEHHDFKILLDTSLATDICSVRESLPAAQAAFSIAQIQLRQGSRSKPESIRGHRFDQLVAAVKRIGLHISPDDVSEPPSSLEDFDWRTFGIMQAGTRLMFGIYNLDVSFSTFYGKPPRIFAEEMQLPLPCGVDAFMAATAEACYDSWIGTTTSCAKTLNNALDALYAEQDGGTTSLLLESLNTLDLFIVILGTSSRLIS